MDEMTFYGLRNPRAEMAAQVALQPRYEGAV